MASLNRPAIGNEAIAFFVVLAFLLGIACVYLYAAIRARDRERPFARDFWCGFSSMSTAE
jgi:NADH:ubiquinone oxidoreductase subunit 3 (subunit A)